MQAAKVSTLDGQAPAPEDFAKYFCTYGYLYHQVRATVALGLAGDSAVLSEPLDTIQRGASRRVRRRRLHRPVP